jgi:hypothetical protein
MDQSKQVQGKLFMAPSNGQKKFSMMDYSYKMGDTIQYWFQTVVHFICGRRNLLFLFYLLLPIGIVLIMFELDAIMKMGFYGSSGKTNWSLISLFIIALTGIGISNIALVYLERFLVENEIYEFYVEEENRLKNKLVNLTRSRKTAIFINKINKLDTSMN